MPRTSLLINDKKFQALRTLLRGYADDNEKCMSDVAVMLGYKDYRSAMKLFKNPENMKLRDLMKLGRTFGIPIEQLRDAAIKY
jgi:hypothetical protein